jgi:hypothetical protein
MLQCLIRAAAGLAIESAKEGGVVGWPTRFSDTVRAYQPNAASARWDPCAFCDAKLATSVKLHHLKAKHGDRRSMIRLGHYLAFASLYVTQQLEHSLPEMVWIRLPAMTAGTLVQHSSSESSNRFPYFV